MQQLGRYQILAELGSGAMGTVFRARDPKIDRVVAIKTVRIAGLTLEQQEEYRRRFFREAQAAGKLSHPGIVTIYDVGEDESHATPYIVMEFVEGQTVERILASAHPNPVPLGTTLELLSQVAEALDYAHSHQIVHRDVKPANILVTADGRAKIADFGIAKLTHAEYTTPGMILGTPAYMSPEQLKGQPVDGRSDLFSLGVILYWMLTGKKPFEGDATAMMFQIACQEPAPPTRQNEVLPAGLDGIVARALAKDPLLRYQRGRELAQDLNDVLHGRAAAAAAGVGSSSAAERTVFSVATPSEEGTVLQAAPSARPVHADASKERPAWKAALSSAYGRATDWYLAQSPKRRLALVAALVLAFALLVSTPWLLGPRGASSPIARTAALLGKPAMVPMHVRSSHTFPSANLWVWVDGDQVLEDRLAGGRPRRGWFRKAEPASFVETVRVPSGKRTIRVRVRSGAYDQTREITADLSANEAKTLVVGFGAQDRSLYLVLRD